MNFRDTHGGFFSQTMDLTMDARKGVVAQADNLTELKAEHEKDCCVQDETPEGYLMPLEFLQAIAAGHPNNVSPPVHCSYPPDTHTHTHIRSFSEEH
jgi:hypothetical protein